MKTHHDDWDDEEREALEPLRDEIAAVRARHRDDPPLDWLRAADAGALPDEIGASVAAHLGGSEWSRALLDGGGTPDVQLDDAGRERILARIRHADVRPMATRGRSRAWFWAPALAAAAILFISVAVWRRPPPPAPTTASATPSAGAPAAPSFVVPIEKPEIRFTATALLLRGEADQGEPFTVAVAPAVKAYKAGDYATAEREFEELGSRYPKSVEVPFYLGVSRLLQGNAPGAIAALDTARRVDQGAFAAEISWYLAAADERAGRRNDARDELRRLCGGSSDLAARSCEAAQKITRE